MKFSIDWRILPCDLISAVLSIVTVSVQNFRQDGVNNDNNLEADESTLSFNASNFSIADSVSIDNGDPSI